MIEDAMFLALGFFTAMLIAFACVPILWARALRLSRRRLEMLVPLSTKEIEADRDGLRAEAAVAQRRLEQRIERRDLTSAEIAAELGRRTSSLVVAERLQEELHTERMSLNAEIVSLSVLLRGGEAQRSAMEKALHDADGRIATGLNDARAEAERYADLQSMAEQRRGTIAALETRCSGLELQIEDRKRDIARLDKLLMDGRASTAVMMRERDAARNDVLLATTQTTRMEIALREEVARGQPRDRQAAAQKAEERRMSNEADMVISAQALADLQHRFDQLQARIVEEAPNTTDDQLGSEPLMQALREAIVAAGDDALRLLGPGREDAAEPEAAAEERKSLIQGDTR